MTFRILLAGMGFAAAVGIAPVVAQHEQHQPGAPASGSSAAQIAQCAQAQPVIARLVEASLKRIDDARLTNSPAAMRDAGDDLQSALIDVRTQLAPCATLQATGEGHTGPVMPNVQQAPAAPSGAPAMKPVSPAPGAPKPPTPAASGADAHVSHSTPAAPASRTPSSARPSSPAPSASHDAESHIGHAPSTAAKAAPLSASGRPTASAPPTNVADLKCSNAVDPRTVPRMLYQGRMYYFCTEASRAEFAKDPSKFVTPPPQSAPAHAH